MDKASHVTYFDTQEHKDIVDYLTNSQMKDLKGLVMDEARMQHFFLESDEMVLDVTRQRIDEFVFHKLLSMAKKLQIHEKLKMMLTGEMVNTTERRAAFHSGLRLKRSKADILPQKLKLAAGCELTRDEFFNSVESNHKHIQQFVENIRNGVRRSSNNQTFTDVVCIGIGGSRLGAEFVYEALRLDPVARLGSKGRRLRFLSSNDPYAFEQAIEGLDRANTLGVIISKTFTTAETMLNAKTFCDWSSTGSSVKDGENAYSASNCCAVTAHSDRALAWGIRSDEIFDFGDWVGGRFSVTSAVGLVPLALHFGWDIVESFLNGCFAMDMHVFSAPIELNMAIVSALCSFFNSTYLGYNCVAIVPYTEALQRFPAHVQQLAMESNGKTTLSNVIPVELSRHHNCEVYFGEPGTNAQHSFFQLLHQGQTVPTEFIGFIQSRKDIHLKTESLSNHDELMCNFFAQPDALALGQESKSPEEDPLALHKFFPGDRPSSVLLFKTGDAFHIGCLLALYEHRVAAQGFLWNINSFDQWGVELGKELAKKVRKHIIESKDTVETQKNQVFSPAFSPSTRKLLSLYIHHTTNSEL